MLDEAVEGGREMADQPSTRPHQPGRGSRPRWVRVRVQTDEGPLIGSIRVEGRWSLYDLLEDGRSYLSLWGTTTPHSQERQEFLALHKSVIRSVTLEVPADRAGSDPKGSETAESDTEDN